MTQIKHSTTLHALALLAVLSFGALALPAFADAASYAYVDATGEVKSVTANDWMTAIATAPNIHIHSGVFILKTAADFEVIGDTVVGAK